MAVVPTLVAIPVVPPLAGPAVPWLCPPTAVPWAALPPLYQTALRVASAEANQWLTMKYDTENPQALRRLVAGGAQLRAFPRDVTQAAFKAAGELYAELSDKSPAFRKIYEHWSKFRAEQVLWAQFCDLPFDNLMSASLRTKSV